MSNSDFIELVKQVPIEEQVPMIWTSQGNLPLSELEYRVVWEITDDYIVFVEEHYHAGEQVRRAPHVLARQSLESSLLAEQRALPPSVMVN